MGRAKETKSLVGEVTGGATRIPVKIPFVTSNFVLPAELAAPVPAPDPSPPAVPKKLVALPPPPPKLVAVPPLDPVPIVAFPINVPVVVLAMFRAPMPLPKPPVGPVETGTTDVMKVGGVTPPPEVLPPFLEPPNVTGMAVPGTSVTTVLNCTGLMPAPKPPAPEEVVVPSKVRIPMPPNVMPTLPA